MKPNITRSPGFRLQSKSVILTLVFTIYTSPFDASAFSVLLELVIVYTPLATLGTLSIPVIVPPARGIYPFPSTNVFTAFDVGKEADVSIDVTTSFSHAAPNTYPFSGLLIILVLKILFIPNIL